MHISEINTHAAGIIKAERLSFANRSEIKDAVDRNMQGVMFSLADRSRIITRIELTLGGL